MRFSRNRPYNLTFLRMLEDASNFTYVGYEEKLSTGVLRFHYSVVHKKEKIDFTETIRLRPIDLSSISAPRRKLIQLILTNLHIALGVSYWKLFCPPVMYTGNAGLNSSQAAFWHTVYRKGLGEFFYKNKIDPRKLPEFPISTHDSNTPIKISPSDRSLVLLGGGKDSVVTAQLLKKAGREFAIMTINAKPVQQDIVKIIAKPLLNIERTLDPKLFELNKRTDTYNGHIPISALYAFLGILAAALYDYSFVVASNEASASYGNAMYLGEEINHQWSKSWEFESLLRTYVDTTLTPGIKYFSLLRPLNEITITKIFSTYPKYFSAVTSCNTNFRIGVNALQPKWCGRCAKCAFVFLLFAAFIPKSTLIEMFNHNLLDDKELLSVFRELLGLSGLKPFECVGTPQESRYAFQMIMKNKDFADTFIIVSLRSELARESQDEDAELPGGHANQIPDTFRAVIANL